MPKVDWKKAREFSWSLPEAGLEFVCDAPVTPSDPVGAGTDCQSTRSAQVPPVGAKNRVVGNVATEDFKEYVCKQPVAQLHVLLVLFALADVDAMNKDKGHCETSKQHIKTLPRRLGE